MPLTENTSFLFSTVAIASKQMRKSRVLKKEVMPWDSLNLKSNDLKEDKMRGKFLMIFCIVCLFLFLTSVVKAEKLSIPACSFIPEGHQAEQLQMSFAWGDCIYRKDNSESNFYAPVYLPQGSIIKWLKLHVVDDDSSYEVAVNLLRLNKYNGARNSIYEARSSGASSSLRHFTDASPSVPALALVNNDVCTYWVGVFFEGGPSGEARKVYCVTICYE